MLCKVTWVTKGNVKNNMRTNIWEELEFEVSYSILTFHNGKQVDSF